MTRKIIIEGEVKTRTIKINGEVLSPKRSQDTRNHSPDGFAWGYGGSGPAQLALGLLMEFTSEKNALALYQKFKWEKIAPLPQTDFKVELNIPAWIRESLYEGAGV
jgi:hypothetical protein